MLALLLAACRAERSFRIVGDNFEKDGVPFRYFSGSFHYFRQHPDYWKDNIRKMADCGLNAVCTYVPWNLHEPRRGEYVWDGIADLCRFLDLCMDHQMLVILRPGPFISAEWEAGGFPWWLLREGVTQIRVREGGYMAMMDAWFAVLFARISRYLYRNGGPIISIQIENEYGGFGSCDREYLRQNCEIVRKYVGDDVVLFTTDSALEYYMKRGTIPELAFATVDFTTGTHPAEPFAMMRRYNDGKGPLVDSEYYTGWIDHWGEYHHTVAAEKVAVYLDEILAAGASVNVYMFFGGTNFGYWQGANANPYNPCPTSYDYDAPLSEAGDMTWKYQMIKEVIGKYRKDMPQYEVANTTKRGYGNVNLTERVSLFDALEDVAASKTVNPTPLSFEELDNGFGFVMYQTQTSGGKLSFTGVSDRARIFVDRKAIAIAVRDRLVDVEVPAGKLQILVENLGRINVGWPTVDSKGLGEVRLNGQALTGWTMYALPMSGSEKVTYTKENKPGEPALYRGTFEVSAIGDTFLNPKGLNHGIAFVNGFNLGRYWTIGPQLTLYVPGPLLNKGTNEVVIFECDGVADIDHISFDDTPQIDIIPHPSRRPRVHH